MIDVSLFDVEIPEWVPVDRELTPEIRALLDRNAHGTALPTDRETWKAWYAGERCRDCGGLMRKLSWSRGCGGTGGNVCDECAYLDPHWGLRTLKTDEERAQLATLQARRRVRYLKEVAS
jgi:hypothetical protein